MGSTPGVVIGALFVTMLPEALRGLSDYRYFAFGALLIIVMVLRPNGLLGTRTPQRA